ncbi:MAG: response regulator [Spirochaetales bacterium]|jgi:two-component system response regulator YesN|nr:response regulator [Spirochaetales bacterium]
MYTLLIADDEQLERDAIELVVNRGGFPLRCLKAKNGREALRMARAEKPDIAFLDIRMPGMDGIQAAKHIREELPGCKIVFLTAWSSFDFAQEAIRVGARDYLVKPAVNKDICALLEKLLADLAAEEKKEQARKRGNDLEAVVNLFSREFFVLIKFAQVSEDAMSSYFRLQGITAEQGLALVCSGFTPKDALARCTKHHACRQARICYFPTVDRITLLVFCENHKAAADGIRQTCALSAKGQFFGAGQPFLSLNGIADSIRTASLAYSDAVHYRLSFCRFGETPRRPRAGAEVRAKQIQQMIRLTLDGMQEEARRLAHEIVDAITSFTSGDVRRQELYDVTLLFSYGIQQNIPCFFREAPQKSGLGMQESYLMDYIDAACAAVAMDRQDKYRRIFDFVRDYIASAYAENLSLDSLANLVGIKPEYFGKLLRKYLGTSFAAYLTEIRVKNAAELLAKGTGVKEAAGRSGFRDGNYFARVFRRYHGCAPRDYRAGNTI